MREIVLVESPYRNGDRNRNLRYLAWCEYHCAEMGEIPIASHGNCTAYWPEDDEHRAKGFAWRDRIREIADIIAYYTDLGTSPGMDAAFLRDMRERPHTVGRHLPPELLARFESGEYQPGSMRRVSVEKVS